MYSNQNFLNFTQRTINMAYLLTDLMNNPNIATEIGKEIESMSWIKSPFKNLIGSGSDRGVRVYHVEKKGPFVPRLKERLQNSGVRGNEEFESNYGNMTILNQTIYPEVVGNGLLSPVFHYDEMQDIDFEKEAKDSLSAWMMDTRDKQLFAALCNDFTNCVVADATDKFKDTTQEKNVKEAAKKIVKGDVVTVKMLEKAVLMARAGRDYKDKVVSYPIKPARAESYKNGKVDVMHYSYIILLDSYGIYQLQQDPEWREMQKYAGVRGDMNNLFMGLAGIISGCPVIDMGSWSKAQAGMPNSEVNDSEFKSFLTNDNVGGKYVTPADYADTQPVSMGALIGGSALLMAGSYYPRIYVEKRDAGRKTAVGIDKVQAIAKAKFANDNTEYEREKGKDFATIGLFYSKE